MTELPHTLIIRRLVKPERIKDYENWLRNASIGIKSFKGCIGIYVIKPMHLHHPEYNLIIQFDTKENLEKFKKSDLHNIWYKELQKISIGHAFRKSYSAFDTLFVQAYSNDTSESQDLPSRYKTFILTLFIAYPVILATNFGLNSLAPNLPSLIKIFLTLLITLTITVFVLIPFLGKILKKWLASY